jgi:hypothetical protein
MATDTNKAKIWAFIRMLSLCNHANYKFTFFKVIRLKQPLAFKRNLLLAIDNYPIYIGAFVGSFGAFVSSICPPLFFFFRIQFVIESSGHLHLNQDVN